MSCFRGAAVRFVVGPVDCVLKYLERERDLWSKKVSLKGFKAQVTNGLNVIYK